MGVVHVCVSSSSSIQGLEGRKKILYFNIRSVLHDMTAHVLGKREIISWHAHGVIFQYVTMLPRTIIF
jgi:hypothetical protein